MNPFRIGERVTGPFFTDRGGELEQVLRAMRHPSRLLVYGPRRFGKSSILEMARERARIDGVLVVNSDLGGATSTVEVADRLATSVAREVDRIGWGTVAEWVRALSLELTTDPGGAPVLRLRLRPGDDPLPQLEAILHRLDDRARESEQTVAVVLDEFQRIVDLGPEGADWSLREAMQGHHHLSYVCAGSEEGVIEQLTSRDGSFHGAFERLYVGTPPTGFEGWIEARMRDEGVRDVDGVGERIAAIAGPRTEDILKLARQVYFRAAARGHCEPSDPEAAMTEIVRADRGLFEALWDRLSPHQRDVLRAVAAGAEGLTSRDVRDRFGLRTSSAVSQAVDTMVRDGLLTRREGDVRFDDPFFRVWVAENLPPGI